MTNLSNDNAATSKHGNNDNDRIVATALKSSIVSKFNFHEILGQGSFAIVRRCRPKRNKLFLFQNHKKQEEYACKTILKATLRLNNHHDNEYHPYYLKAMQREIDCLFHLSNKTSEDAMPASNYILQSHHVYEDFRHIHIVTDYYPNTMDLYDYLHHHGGGDNNDNNNDDAIHLSESDSNTIIQQLLTALSYCHQNGVVHRDIKPENILILSSDTIQIKLIDFGLARRIDTTSSSSSSSSFMRSRVGTVYYVAPEVMNGKLYGETCDVWSAGVILYLMLTGALPFLAKTEAQTLRLVQKGTYQFPSAGNALLSSESQACCRYLMNVDTTKRPSADQALNHHWLSSSSSKHHQPVQKNDASSSSSIQDNEKKDSKRFGVWRKRRRNMKQSRQKQAQTSVETMTSTESFAIAA